MLHLYLLGPFRLENETGILRLPTRKVESLLAYLVLHPGEHSRAKLAALFWGDSLDTQARDSLRTALTNLRKHLGENLILTDRETVQFNPAFPLWVDVNEFLIDQTARRPTANRNPQSAIENLSRTNVKDPESQVSLYQGELLDGLVDEWILPVRERLQERYLDVLLQLAREARERGETTQAIEWARQLLARDAAHERAHQELMLCYSALGNRLAALKQYQECERVLKQELDVEPSPETTALYQEIKSAAPAPPPASPRSHVPVALTSFIGRQKEIEEIHQQLAHNRLVTLTGAGGSGKTRLAIHVATAEENTYPGGVIWVELAALNEPARIPYAVAKACDLREVPHESMNETLARYFLANRALIVLDNCEHLIDACAAFAESLLQASPQLTILATSREPLGVPGERVYPVPMLELPRLPPTISAQQVELSQRSLLSQHNLMQQHAALQHEAPRLFLDRALAVKPDLALDATSTRAIVQICQRLDGMPLAIELAAARVTVLSTVEIAARLDDRFHLLSHGSRTALPRRQTLLSTLEWSHDLLTDAERTLFRRLSVFSGSWTLEAANAICAGDTLSPDAILDVLSRLVDKSLVIASPHSDGSRYHMLETIHAYAREKLRGAGQEEELRTRHLNFYLAFTEQAQYELHAADQAVWFMHLEQEQANIRAALAWALASRAIEAGMRIVGALHWFWWIRGYWNQAREWAVQFISQPEAQTRTYARGQALGAAGDFTYELGDLEAGEAYIREAVAIGRELGDAGKTLVGEWMVGVGYIEWTRDLNLALRAFEQGLAAMENTPTRDRWITAWLHHVIGATFRLQGDYVRAREHSEKSISISRRSGDRYMCAYPLRELGSILALQGQLEQAKQYHLEALASEREMGDRKDSATSLTSLGDIAIQMGNYVEARTFLEEAHTISRELGWRTGIAYQLYYLGFAEQLSGNFARAQQLYREALPLCLTYGDQSDMVNTLDGLAQLAAIEQEYENAARLFGAASARITADFPLWNAMQREHDRWYSLVRQALGDETFTALEQQGRTLPPDQLSPRQPTPPYPLPLNPQPDVSYLAQDIQ